MDMGLGVRSGRGLSLVFVLILFIERDWRLFYLSVVSGALCDWPECVCSGLEIGVGDYKEFSIEPRRMV
jgi:hypothetical protein